MYDEDTIIRDGELDNMVDMVNKSRAVGHVGENNPNAKLSKEDIIVIRTLLNIGKKPRHILPLFAISRTQLGRIRTSESWKFI